jgi:SAM-dependent methyltransferase
MEHVICNLCEGDDFTPCCVVGRFRVVRCATCGLFYTNPRRSLEETAELYSEQYFSSDDPSSLGYEDYSAHADGLKRISQDNLDIIETYVRPPSLIVDVGCAFGYFLEVASSRGWQTQGVEISAYAAEAARKRVNGIVHAGTLASAGIEASTIDAVTMWDALEHSLDPTATLAEARRILRPGGHLFMTLPNAGSFPARIMGSHWYGFKSAAEHNYFFSPHTIGRMLEKTGLSLVEIRRGEWPCSAKFLAAKIAPYSKPASRLADWLIRLAGAEKKIVKFKFIDMFVVARKDS